MLLFLHLALASDIAFHHQPPTPGTRLDEELVTTRTDDAGWTRTEESLRFKVAKDSVRLTVRSALRTSSEHPKPETYGLHDSTHTVTGELTDDDPQGLSIASVRHMTLAGAIGSGLHGVPLSVGDTLTNEQLRGFVAFLGEDSQATLTEVSSPHATFTVTMPDASGTLVLDARNSRLVAMDVEAEDDASGEPRTLRFERTLSWKR